VARSVHRATAIDRPVEIAAQKASSLWIVVPMETAAQKAIVICPAAKSDFERNGSLIQKRVPPEPDRTGLFSFRIVGNVPTAANITSSIIRLY